MNEVKEANLKNQIELTEAEAVAVVVLLNNHVMAMQAWVQKLKRPFMPYHANMMANYPPPTLQSILHIMKGTAMMQRELLAIAQAVAEKAKAEVKRQDVFSGEKQ
jgi:hypothetical protein